MEASRFAHCCDEMVALITMSFHAVGSVWSLVPTVLSSTQASKEREILHRLLGWSVSLVVGMLVCGSVGSLDGSAGS